MTRQWVEHARKAGQTPGAGASDGTFAAGVNHVTELLPSIMTDITNTAPEDQKVRSLDDSRRIIRLIDGATLAVYPIIEFLLLKTLAVFFKSVLDVDSRTFSRIRRRLESSSISGSVEAPSQLLCSLALKRSLVLPIHMVRPLSLDYFARR